MPYIEVFPAGGGSEPHLLGEDFIQRKKKNRRENHGEQRTSWQYGLRSEWVAEKGGVLGRKNGPRSTGLRRARLEASAGQRASGLPNRGRHHSRPEKVVCARVFIRGLAHKSDPFRRVSLCDCIRASSSEVDSVEVSSWKKFPNQIGATNLTKAGAENEICPCMAQGFATQSVVSLSAIKDRVRKSLKRHQGEGRKSVKSEILPSL